MSNFKLKLLGFLFIGFTVFFGFVLPRKNWFFFGDDYGAVYGGQKGCLGGITQFFKSYPNDATTFPSNFKDKNYSFESTTYRPLFLIVYALEYFLFGHESAWPYFLVSIFLHAFAAGLLFLLFFKFFSFFSAIIMALCFGFYPIMGRFIGCLSIQSYSINLILAILCLFCFLEYFKTGRAIFVLVATFLFTVSVFVIENLFFMPLMFFLPIIFFKINWIEFKRCVKFSFALSLGCFAHVFAKLAAFELFDTARLNFVLYRPIGERFANWLTLVTDTFAMTGIPEGNRAIKFSILMFFLLLLTTGFLYSMRKRNYFGLFFAFILACWPVLIFQHGHRYLYFSTPIFLFSLALCFQDLYERFNFGLIKTFKYLLFGVILIVGLIECDKSLSAFEKKTGFVEQIFKQISKEVAEKQREIIFVAMPTELFPLSCIAQTIWLYSGTQKAVFYDPGLNLQSTFNNTVYFWPINKNLFRAGFKNPILELFSIDPKKLWLGKRVYSGKIDPRFGIGEILSLGVSSENKLKSIRIKIYDQIIKERPIFVSWDYENKEFCF